VCLQRAIIEGTGLLLLTMSNKNRKYQLQRGGSNAVPPRVCLELIRQYRNVDRCSILRRQTAAIIKFKISSVERVKFGGPLNLAALCGRIARVMPKAGSANKVHVAATELQQLLKSTIQIYLEIRPHKCCCQTLCSSKVN